MKVITVTRVNKKHNNFFMRKLQSTFHERQLSLTQFVKEMLALNKRELSKPSHQMEIGIQLLIQTFNNYFQSNLGSKISIQHNAISKLSIKTSGI